MTTVVALGGNALVGRGERGTVAEQRANLRRHCAALEPLLADPLVVTHGNGPQVGADLLRSERAADEVPPLPLWLAVAQTQAEIGSLIALELGPVAGRRVACVVTHVRVDSSDDAFAMPTKPVGPFYSTEQARLLERQCEWKLAEEPGRGWRRLVASPRPLEIVEVQQVRELVAAGAIAVACGGGGIPVTSRNGRLEGVDAVIDKDYASHVLARALGADRLVILTEVDAVFEAFGTARQRRVPSLTPDAAAAWLDALPAGSMRPKVDAAATFARETGGTALITSAEVLSAALRGEAGTRIAG